MTSEPTAPIDERRLRATAHGRSEGWDVELDGRAVAFLDQPRFEDMFWISYRITPTTEDADLAAQLLSEEFWRDRPLTGLRFRSRALGLVAPHAFPSAGPFVEPGRLNMRALYLRLEDTRPPTRAEAGATIVAAQPCGWLARLRGWLTGRRGAAS